MHKLFVGSPDPTKPRERPFSPPSRCPQRVMTPLFRYTPGATNGSRALYGGSTIPSNLQSLRRAVTPFSQPDIPVTSNRSSSPLRAQLPPALRSSHSQRRPDTVTSNVSWMNLASLDDIPTCESKTEFPSPRSSPLGDHLFGKGIAESQRALMRSQSSNRTFVRNHQRLVPDENIVVIAADEEEHSGGGSDEDLEKAKRRAERRGFTTVTVQLTQAQRRIRRNNTMRSFRDEMKQREEDALNAAAAQAAATSEASRTVSSLRFSDRSRFESAIQDAFRTSSECIAKRTESSVKANRSLSPVRSTVVSKKTKPAPTTPTPSAPQDAVDELLKARHVAHGAQMRKMIEDIQATKVAARREAEKHRVPQKWRRRNAPAKPTEAELAAAKQEADANAKLEEIQLQQHNWLKKRAKEWNRMDEAAVGVLHLDVVVAWNTYWPQARALLRDMKAVLDQVEGDSKAIALSATCSQQLKGVMEVFDDPKPFVAEPEVLNQFRCSRSSLINRNEYCALRHPEIDPDEITRFFSEEGSKLSNPPMAKAVVQLYELHRPPLNFNRVTARSRLAEELRRQNVQAKDSQPQGAHVSLGVELLGTDRLWDMWERQNCALKLLRQRFQGVLGLNPVHVMKAFRTSLSPKQIAERFREHDRDGDGYLSLEEFSSFLGPLVSESGNRRAESIVIEADFLDEVTDAEREVVWRSATGTES